MALALGCIIIGQTLFSGALGASDRVRVFLRFAQAPTVAACRLVQGRHGRIRYAYHHQPLLAVEVPRSLLAVLEQEPGLISIEPDPIVELLDAELDASWGVKRINAGSMHPTSTGAGIKVAVVDTGIDYHHPDLDANYRGGYDFVNDDANPVDDYGHGTHVAGILAAENNEAGVVGVAPDAWLYGVKVIDERGLGAASDLVAGIEWCIDNGMDIVNMSMRVAASQAVEQACAEARARGLVLVAAAGNQGTIEGEGEGVVFPAKLDSVIAVAATDKRDERALFSSTGLEVELAAPGTRVNSLRMGGGYETMSGTSMAAPHVAGAAALIWAEEPMISATAVRTRLQELAIDLGEAGRDRWYGYGRVRVGELETDRMYVFSVAFAVEDSNDDGIEDVSAVATVHRDQDGDGVAEANDSPVSGAAVQWRIDSDCDGNGSYEHSIEQAGVSENDGQVRVLLGAAACERYRVEVVDLVHDELAWHAELDQGNPALYSRALAARPVRFDAVFPNPTAGEARIEYTLTSDSFVRIEIWTVSGERVALLAEAYQAAGSYSTAWDGRNNTGQLVAAGTYLVMIRAEAGYCIWKLAVRR